MEKSAGDWSQEYSGDPFEDKEFMNSFEEWNKEMDKRLGSTNPVTPDTRSESADTRGASAPKESIQRVEKHAIKSILKHAKTVEEYNAWAKVIRDEKACAFIMFSTSWCGPCRTITPRIEKFLQQNPTINFLKVDGDACEKVIKQFQIRSYPTFICIKNTKIEKRIIGADWGLLQDALYSAIEYAQKEKK
jgi:thioredoxin 1